MIYIIAHRPSVYSVRVFVKNIILVIILLIITENAQIL